jgi:hypothetical protein
MLIHHALGGHWSPPASTVMVAREIRSMLLRLSRGRPDRNPALLSAAAFEDEKRDEKCH